jgi:hypothetical protein
LPLTITDAITFNQKQLMKELKGNDNIEAYNLFNFATL